jgi:PEP-CTERM motif
LLSFIFADAPSIFVGGQPGDPQHNHLAIPNKAKRFARYHIYLEEIAMSRSLAAALAFTTTAALFGTPSFAQSANSLFICDVPASAGGCVDGSSSPAGSATFTFSGITDGDSFIGGLPANSPTTVSESGTDLPDLGLAQIFFSFSWLAMGTTTTPQTIFFTQPDGDVSAVLNFAYSREGLDLTNVFGYLISAETPVTAAQLAADGIVPTGTESASGPFNFPNADIAATFEPGVAIPEPSTWAMMMSGFAALGAAAFYRRSAARVA